MVQLNHKYYRPNNQKLEPLVQYMKYIREYARND